MNRTFKKLLISGASLLMLAGVGAGINNVVKPAHASAPIPDYYYSTRHKDGVYYNVQFGYDHGRKVYIENIYGPMPKAMRRKHNLFGLYYGKDFSNPLPFKVLHRHGQTYLPDYVGYVDEGGVKVNGHKGFVMVVYVNKRDVGRPYRHQLRAFHSGNAFTSQRQFLVPSRTKKLYHHARRHHSKKSRLIRFRKGHRTYYARVYKVSND